MIPKSTDGKMFVFMNAVRTISALTAKERTERMNEKQTIDTEQETKQGKQIALPTGEYEMDIRADGSVLIRPKM